VRPDLKGALGFGVSALVLWWTLRGVALAEVWEVLTTTTTIQQQQQQQTWSNPISANAKKPSIQQQYK